MLGTLVLPHPLFRAERVDSNFNDMIMSSHNICLWYCKYLDTKIYLIVNLIMITSDNKLNILQDVKMLKKT